jgi:hypothetical protein
VGQGEFGVGDSWGLERSTRGGRSARRDSSSARVSRIHQDEQVLSKRRSLPAVAILWLIPLVIISTAAGAFFGIALVSADLAGAGLWLRSFAQSPGAAAFAALIAAAIAFTGISRQVSVSRASLDHQRDAASSDRWWAMFEWVSDRAIPPRRDDEPLPTSVTIATLERLAESATTKVQEAACAGVIDALTKKIEGTIEEPSGEDTPFPSSDQSQAALLALESYVESSRGTPAASGIAEALIYENNVSKALMSVTLTDPEIRVFRNPPGDAIAEVGGRRVIIEIKASRDVSQLKSAALRSLRSLRELYNPDALLLITPVATGLRPEELAPLRAVAVRWSGPSDTDSLAAALRSARELE